MKAILFDFDGTLVNSQPAVDDAVNKFLKKRNIVLKKEEQFFLTGMSLKDFAEVLSKKEQTIIHESEFNVNAPEILAEIDVFPRTKNTLSLLKSRGYKIALVTNSPRAYVDHLMERLQLKEYFDSVVTVTEAKVAKPNPLMLEIACKELNTIYKECIMIDDNVPGIEAGKKLNMLTVRVGSEKQEADFLVSSVEKLPALLEKIHFQEL